MTYSSSVLKASDGDPKTSDSRPSVIRLPWYDGNVALAHGTRVRMRYGRQHIDGQILDGHWVVRGKAYPSPSTAASAAARTKGHRKTRLNGWLYWQVYFPATGHWVPLHRLR